MYGQLVYTISMIPQIILASYFPVKILYASVISPLSRVYFIVGKFRYFNLSSYLSVMGPFDFGNELFFNSVLTTTYFSEHKLQAKNMSSSRIN